MTAILDFYRGTGTDAQGRTLEDVLAFDDIQMERVHDYIQWMFPLPEPSRAQPQSPVLTEADLEVFRGSQELKGQVTLALRRFTAFLVATEEWKRPRDHNHLRLSRILRFLTLIEMPSVAQRLHHYVRIHSDARQDTRWYWQEARKAEPSYLHGGYPPLSE